MGMSTVTTLCACNLQLPFTTVNINNTDLFHWPDCVYCGALPVMKQPETRGKGCPWPSLTAPSAHERSTSSKTS
jgi:hypothetical protein